MVGSVSTTKPVDLQLPRDCVSLWNLRLKALLVFFTHRIWRGGARLLLQATACILALLVLFRLGPSRLGDGYQGILNWPSLRPQDAAELRIVVFGSQDLLGSAVDAHKARTTWTEQLCTELNCSLLLSFVPKGTSKPGLTSNGLYATELRALGRQTNRSDAANPPAPNYDFVLEQYPVPLHTPDLEAQIRQFLSLPPPAIAPRRTLWVFTFGTWDIWNLAALPRQSGQDAVDALVSHLFSQVELLYRRSLSPTSIAFSDFWFNATEYDIDRLADPNAPEKLDERELESFRVVFPELFDMTLAPGWQKRPGPPAPHSKAEHMRNADFLTRRWNSQINAELGRWKDKARTRSRGIDEAIRLPRAGAIFEYLPAALRPHRAPEDEPGKQKGVVYAPYPRRSGLQSSPAAALLDAMTEEEMQRSGLRDGRGRGTLPINSTMRFSDVWTPCTASAGGVAGFEPRQSHEEGCSNPDEHLFHDAFTLGQRAIEGLTKSTATKISHELFVSKEEKPGGSGVGHGRRVLRGVET